MSISASDVAKLRQLTGVGMMEAKKALEETGGDTEKAMEELRKRGAAKAAKKSDRVTGEGRVHGYTHGTGKIGVMVEVLCETDFVARNEAFIAFCADIAMHIAASNPLYVSRDEVPEELVEKEKSILKEMLVAEGKPVDMLEKIVEGKLSKFYADMCLLEQSFIKDEDLTIQKLLESKIASLGENIRIHRFSRMQIG